MGFFVSFQAMLSLTIIFGLGYTIARMGWTSPEVEIFLPRFLTGIVIPPFLAGNIVTHFRHDNFLQLVGATLVPALSIAITLVLFYLLAVLVRIDRKHRMVFMLGSGLSNTLFIGIPVNIALFGEQALPSVLLYFFANTVFFWGLGSYLLSLEGEGGHGRHSLADSLRRIFSPPVCGMLTGVVLVMAGIPLPKVILDVCGYLGGLATPLALIFLGVTLNRIDWKKEHIGKDVLLAIFCRLTLCPLVMVGMLQWLPLPPETAHVFIIQSALPCVSNLPVLTAYYGADKQYASTIVATSTILGMLTVPLWMSVISAIGV